MKTKQSGKSRKSPAASGYRDYLKMYGYADPVIDDVFTKIRREGEERRRRMAAEEQKRQFLFILDSPPAPTPAPEPAGKPFKVPSGVSVTKTPPAPSQSPPAGRKVTEITPGPSNGKPHFRGHKPTAVIRWLANQRYSREQIEAVLELLGMPTPANTVKTQISAVKSGSLSHGPVPKLKRSEADELRSLVPELEKDNAGQHRISRQVERPAKVQGTRKGDGKADRGKARGRGGSDHKGVKRGADRGGRSGKRAGR